MKPLISTKFALICLLVILTSGCLKDEPAVAVAKCAFEFNKNHAQKYIGRNDDSLHQKGQFCKSCMESQGYTTQEFEFIEAYISPPGFLDALKSSGTGWENIKPADRTPEVNQAIKNLEREYTWKAVAWKNCSPEAWGYK